MTHKEKLEAVSKDIRTKLPELTKVSRGCRLKRYDETILVSDIDELYNIYFFIKVGSHRYERKGEIDVQNQTLDKYPVTILGHDIQLHHVLKWFKIVESRLAIDSFGQLMIQYGSSGGISRYADVIGVVWNLDKPLKDQSKELIDYLYSLIN